VSQPTIGVFALQGDVREHLTTLDSLGVPTLRVRRPEDLMQCHALVLPGGESTTMDKLTRAFGLFEPLCERIREGMPAFGTCAGMIMLANQVTDGLPDQHTLGGLDITVRRNAFGRQVDSFETDLKFDGLVDLVHAVFIRAPWVESVGESVEILARVEVPQVGGSTELPTDKIVAVRSGPLLATSFHPEVSGDIRIHQLFVDSVRAA
jgi:pyridoxal 5'-phosphate synthase pdxT subunit